MDIAATHSQNMKPSLGQPLAAEFKLQLRERWKHFRFFHTLLLSRSYRYAPLRVPLVYPYSQTLGHNIYARVSTFAQ